MGDELRRRNIGEREGGQDERKKGTERVERRRRGGRRDVRWKRDCRHRRRNGGGHRGTVPPLEPARGGTDGQVPPLK